MNFQFSPEEEKFQEEVRKFFLAEEKVVTAAREEWDAGQGFGPNCWEIMRKIGAKGWLCPMWPKEYGGLGLPYMYRYIIMEQMQYFLNMWATVGAGMAGPIILHHGSEQQKKQYLPAIARGEIEFALGYTEPQAGSDVSSLNIRAEDKGDHFLINGTKLFNTRTHYANYHWLGARTEVITPKYKGISLIIVDLKSPGISVSKILTVGGRRTNEVCYDNVVVPKENLVGEKNRGIYYIMEALDYERITAISGLERDFADLVDYAKKQGKDLHPQLCQDLADVATDVEASKLLALRVAWMLNNGTVPNYEAAMLKMVVSEVEQNMANLAMRIMGPYGQLKTGSPWTPSEGKFEWIYRDTLENLITRGTSEIMRNIIAQRGLGLPRN
jgi:alkylation response protein AidB-like acyl-CoA dehydrogenase